MPPRHKGPATAGLPEDLEEKALEEPRVSQQHTPAPCGVTWGCSCTGRRDHGLQQPLCGDSGSYPMWRSGPCLLTEPLAALCCTWKHLGHQSSHCPLRGSGQMPEHQGGPWPGNPDARSSAMAGSQCHLSAEGCSPPCSSPPSSASGPPRPLQPGAAILPHHLPAVLHQVLVAGQDEPTAPPEGVGLFGKSPHTDSALFPQVLTTSSCHWEICKVSPESSSPAAGQLQFWPPPYQASARRLSGFRPRAGG